ncbi:MAG: ribose-phosphate pyrophosphokinase [Lachnospirales bacterium]
MVENRTFGDLGILALRSTKELSRKIDTELKARREFRDGAINQDTYILNVNEVRFSNGEAKFKLAETVRGKDVYIICDIGNYSCTYSVYGFENHMGPDEHFQDIKRALSAIGGKSRRTTVIMPLLYASRQHRRKGRESLDCALALQELEKMGVSDIITFDVHDPNIQNAIPLASFENIYPTYPIVKKIFEHDLTHLADITNTIVISPDTGAMDRAIYYAGVMGCDIGLFYKRRDYTKIVRGKNPIINHEYMGPDIKGKNILIVDDMIASGESSLDIATELKSRGAEKILIAASFALFTEGLSKFDEAYKNNLFDRVYATNLTYVPDEVLAQEWYLEVDMSKYIAELIDYLNYDKSISKLMDATYPIKSLMKKMS